LLLGALAGSAAGRVLYQMALTTTKDDNSYAGFPISAAPLDQSPSGPARRS